MAYSRIRFEIQNSATMTLVHLFAIFRYGFCRCNLLADFRYKDYALEDPFFALWIRRSKQQAEIGLSPVGK